MANVISGTDYNAIATNYSEARDRVVSAVDYLFEAVYQVVLLQSIVPEVDLLQEFFNSYQINNEALRSTVNLLPAVRSLNNHVLRRSDEESLDAYLTSEGITVPASWASLSQSVGFTISNGNIA
mgnify:CR=1 FL=1